MMLSIFTELKNEFRPNITRFILCSAVSSLSRPHALKLVISVNLILVTVPSVGDVWNRCRSSENRCMVVKAFIALPKITPLCLTAVTLPRYTPQSYHSPHHSSERVNQNPTIRISRATRVMESNASLDRIITDPKELQNLDEFLGSQVRNCNDRENERNLCIRD